MRLFVWLFVMLFALIDMALTLIFYIFALAVVGVVGLFLYGFFSAFLN